MRAIGERFESMARLPLRYDGFPPASAGGQRGGASRWAGGLRVASWKAIRAALFGTALAVLAQHALAVELTMRDTTFHAPDTLRIAILADSIPESQGVLSYQFVIQFDSTVLVGVGGDAEGTITAPFGDPFTSGDSFAGELRVAAAGIQPVWGSGSFVTVLLRAASDTGGVTTIRFESALLNEGSPPVTYPDPLATVTVLGPSAVEPRMLPSRVNMLTVSPNPSRGQITLALPSGNYPLQARLWNVLGQQIATSNASSSRAVLNLAHFPDGIYFVTIDQRPELIARFYLLR